MSKNSKQKMALRKKRHPSKPTTTTAENKSKQKQKPTADLNWKSISSKIRSVMIEVPFELSTKEARKFRKDKRREAREKGDAEPTFTNATSATVATREKSNAEESNQQLLQKTGGKRKRPSYAPSIRDLLEKERESAKLEAVKREHEKEVPRDGRLVPAPATPLPMENTSREILGRGGAPRPDEVRPNHQTTSVG